MISSQVVCGAVESSIRQRFQSPLHAVSASSALTTGHCLLMRRKTIIVLVITFMVTVMVTAFSYLYISQILRLRITNAYEERRRLTQQLAYFAENDLPDLSSTRIDTNDPAAVRRALAEYLPMDTNLLNNLESEVALWPFIYDVSVVDSKGKALLHTNRQLVGKQIPRKTGFS